MDAAGVDWRAALTRTAKSCGPGAPTLALNPQRRIPRLAGDGGKKARFTEESSKQPLKPFAQGRPEWFRLHLWFLPRAFFSHGGRGCGGHPAFPAPSVLGGTRLSAKTRALRAARMRSY